jgi:GntR family transcriptional repressor for pyruvate dehydrogenase complex
MNAQAIFKPVKNTTLSAAVAEQILAMLADGHLKPGDRLPTEPELMAQFNVGRSTLREALKSLAMAGLIETRRSAGTFVSKSYTDFLSNHFKWATLFSERELRDITEVRYALEGQTAFLAAERATADQKEKLAHLYAAMIEAQAPDRATEFDTAFHVAIAAASHNPLLLNLILNIRNLIRDYIQWGYTRQGYADRVDPNENITHHLPILAAIQAGQPEAARQAMLNHLAYSAEWMLAVAKERQ